jgi:molybdopterin-containing oxidoreductase family membrane subunit
MAEQSKALTAAAEVEAHLIGTLGPMSRRLKIVVGGLSVIVATGVIAWIYQLWRGLAVTAMTDYFSWGVYIVDFVFFIGISMAGTLISAILRLTGAEWRRPITRMAEGVTVIALLLAAAMIVVDMGRPDRLWKVFIYGRFQSPIIWDVMALNTYLVGSALYLYLPLIPDLAILRDHPANFSRWRRWLYTKLALGWRGSAEQHRVLERGVAVLAIVLIPVAISIHTVTAWLFGTTLRPGWHSTIIGPDFVIGALYSGIAAVLTVMALFRWMFHLDRYVTLEHFKKLSLLLLVSCFAYMYFVINEYMGPGYTGGSEQHLLSSIFSGAFALQFWSMVVIGLLIPAFILVLPQFRTVKGIVIAALLVNVGMWLKRFIIVVPTLSSPFMPPSLAKGSYLTYFPTWVEWTITASAFAASCLFYIVFSKIFPIVSIWEVAETAQKEAAPQGSGEMEAMPCAS